MFIKIGPLSLLFILFVGLKLGGVIAWSWWWVASPIWVPIALFFIVIIIIFIIAGVVACCS